MSATTDTTASADITQADIDDYVDELQHTADEHYINDEYSDAVELYNKANKLNDRNINVLLHRAQCLIKLSKYIKAEVDCKRVLMLTQNQSHIALYRCGITLFHQDRFNDANKMFSKCNAVKPNYLQTDMYLRKCAAELDDDNSNGKPNTMNCTSTSTATKSTVSPADSNNQSTNKLANKTIGNRKTSTEPKSASLAGSTTITTTAAPTVSSSADATTSTGATATTAGPLNEKVRTEFYQMNNDVVMTIFAKNVKSDQCSIALSDDGSQLHVNIQLPDSSLYQHNYLLYGSVSTNSNDINIRITAYKIEISLKKLVITAWSSLERSETAAEQSDRLSKLPSAYANKRNIDWDDVDKSVAKQLEDESSEVKDKV